MKTDFEWVTEELGQIAKMTSGGTPNKKHTEYYEGGTIPWVRSGELDRGLILDTEIKITQAGLDNSSAKIFPKGTLLIALYGATIGKLGFLGIDACTNQAVCAIFKNDKVSLKYLYYYLLLHRSKLIEQGIGGAQPNISQTILKKLPVRYPKGADAQALVVQEVETKISQCDNIKATLEVALKETDILRYSILKQAFEGKL